MKKIILFTLLISISFTSHGRLFYKCNHVYIGARQHNDINVIFMTGYEVLDNLPDNKLSIVKAKKYAMVLLDSEISVVLLDDPQYSPEYNLSLIHI